VLAFVLDKWKIYKKIYIY